MNVLLLNEVPCFPPNAGEKLRTFNIISSILKFCDNLHLISGNAPPDDKVFEKVKFYKIPDGFFVSNRWKKLPTYILQNKELRRLIIRILEEEKIDIAILDYNFLGNYISIFKKRGIKVIYGTHNVQSKLNLQVPAEGIKNHFFKNTRYAIEKYHEDHYFKQADVIICVSDNDKEYYDKRFPNQRIFVIPNYINEEIYNTHNGIEKKNQLIMAANYSAFQNRHGLEWFIAKVWDPELAGMTKFVIAGHKSVRELWNLKNKGYFTQNITALGSVEDMKVHIAESKAAIIPLLHGSGTRLKCIEAMALKTNIVSTSIGVEGIDHEGSILLADQPSEFKKQLKSVLTQEINNEEKAFEVFLEKYSSRANTGKLEYIIRNT